jgi:hypothetical protein
MFLVMKSVILTGILTQILNTTHQFEIETRPYEIMRSIFFACSRTCKIPNEKAAYGLSVTVSFEQLNVEQSGTSFSDGF